MPLCTKRQLSKTAMVGLEILSAINGQLLSDIKGGDTPLTCSKLTDPLVNVSLDLTVRHVLPDQYS